MRLNWAHGLGAFLIVGAVILNYNHNQEIEARREQTRKELALAYAKLTPEMVERAVQSLRHEIAQKISPGPHMVRLHPDLSLSNVLLVSYNSPFTIECRTYRISLNVAQDAAYASFSDYTDAVPFEMQSVAGKKLQPILCAAAVEAIHDIFYTSQYSPSMCQERAS